MVKSKKIKTIKFFARMAVACMLVAVLIFVLLPYAGIGAMTARAEEQNSTSYTAFEKLRNEIDNPLGRELNFVSGTVAFPTPITINRDIYIEAVGQPAEFVFDYDDEYPQNDKLISDAQYYPQNRHFIIWAEEEVQSVQQPNEYLVVWFENIIFRASDGFGGIFAPNGNVKLYFKNCIFEGLGGEYVWGGALALASYTSNIYGSTTNSFFQVEVNNCTFINNYAICGGAMFAVSHVAEELTRVKFQNCIFSNNSASWKDKNVRVDSNISSAVYINCIDVDFDIEGDVILQIRNGYLPLPVKTGYNFSHWENEAGEPIEFSGNEILEIGQMTLSAVWTAKTFTITYHNIETQSGFPETHTYGQPTVIPKPEKDGYIFKGWLLAGEDESIEYLTLLSQGFLDNIVMSAVWEKFTPPEKFPVWGVVLIIAGGVMLAVSIFAALYVVLRRKFSLANAMTNDLHDKALIVDSSDKAFVGNEGFDKLAAAYNLTAREKEIAKLICDGKSRTTIATELFVSIGTVKKHTENIYKKLGIKSKYELFAKLNKN